jgi:hypothetical protein
VPFTIHHSVDIFTKVPVLFSELANGLGMALSCQGAVRGQELVDAQSRLLDHSEKIPHWMFAVLDQSSVTLADYSSDEVHLAAAQDRHLSTLTRPGFVVALIAVTDYQFGICRMWQLLTDDVPWRTCVFRDPHLAESWVREEVRTKFGVSLPNFLGELPQRSHSVAG